MIGTPHSRGVHSSRRAPRDLPHTLHLNNQQRNVISPPSEPAPGVGCPDDLTREASLT